MTLKSTCCLCLVISSTFIVAAKPSPNIVFILADDYGYGDIGYHGSDIKTPNLDSLAKSGIRLENYYVQPLCTASRSQLLSGRYQIHTGLQHDVILPTQRNALPLECVTLAQQLKTAGYSTHMIGKWHLGFFQKEYMPHNRGFDTFFGYLNADEDHYTHESCSYSVDFPQDCGVDFRENNEVLRNYDGDYSTNIFTDKAIEKIREHNQSKPLFLYMAHQNVHAPLQVPDEYIEPYRNMSNPDKRKLAGMVAILDESVGNLTQALKDAGLYDNTIIVFSTDNGGEVLVGGSNYPLRGNKGTLFEGGMRGIGFVHSPLLDSSLHGSVNKELLHVTDWYPTLVNLAGGSYEGYSIDGHDVWDAIRSKTKSPRKELLHNIDPLFPQAGREKKGSPFDVRTRAAIRSGPWKLITGNPNTLEDAEAALPHQPFQEAIMLFNIDEDPEEEYDESHEFPEVVNYLLGRLSFYNSSAVPARYPEGDPKAIPSTHEGAWVPWVRSGVDTTRCHH